MISVVPKLLWGKISDTVVRAVRLDSSTHGIIAITPDQWAVHQGISFTCHFHNEVTNIGEETVIAFNTPDTAKWLHMFLEVQTSGAAHFPIYEEPSIDVDEGTQLTVYNKDRNSAGTSGITSIETTPVVNKATSFNETQAATANISATTEIYRLEVGSGLRKTVGGTGGGDVRLILGQDKQYAFLIESLTDDDAHHNITLNWAECENKD